MFFRKVEKIGTVVKDHKGETLSVKVRGEGGGVFSLGVWGEGGETGRLHFRTLLVQQLTREQVVVLRDSINRALQKND